MCAHGRGAAQRGPRFHVRMQFYLIGLRLCEQLSGSSTQAPGTTRSCSLREPGKVENAFILPVTFLRCATQTNKTAQRRQPGPARMERHGGELSHPTERRVVGIEEKPHHRHFVRRSKI